MNTTNFKLQSSLEANYLSVALREPIRLDGIAVKVLREDCPDFLVPFRMVTVNNVFTLRYTLINMTALSYINMTLKRQEFLRLYISLLRPFMEGGDWFLDYHYFCIDPTYVFISRDLTQAYYVYIPENDYKNSEEEVLGFFRSVLDRISITDNSDILVRLYQYFSKGQVTLADLYAMLQKESKASDKNREMRQPDVRGKEGEGRVPMASAANKEMPGPMEATAGQPALNTDNRAEEIREPRKKGFFGIGGDKKESGEKRAKKEQKKEEPANTGQNIGLPMEEDEVMNLLFGEGSGRKAKEKRGKEKTSKEKPPKEKPQREKAEKGKSGFGLFGAKKEKTPTVPISEPAPAPNAPMSVFSPETIIEAPESEETEVLGGESYQEQSCLELMDSAVAGAISRIALDFPGDHMTIGRTCSEAVKADIQFSNEFGKMSRMHARIERRGSEFYVIDLGSKNHTLLNGKAMIPNHPYQLHSGAELTFTTNQPVRYKVIL